MPTVTKVTKQLIRIMPNIYGTRKGNWKLVTSVVRSITIFQDFSLVYISVDADKELGRYSEKPSVYMHSVPYKRTELHGLSYRRNDTLGR